MQLCRMQFGKCFCRFICTSLCNGRNIVKQHLDTSVDCPRCGWWNKNNTIERTYVRWSLLQIFWISLRFPNVFAALVYSDLITAMPFENTVDTLDLRGNVLRDVLEHSVSASYDADRFNGKFMCHVAGKSNAFPFEIYRRILNTPMLSFEGLRVVYNVTNAPFNRVVSVEVLSTDASKPVYQPLEETETYTVIVASFLVNGGDGFRMIPENMHNHK